MLCQLLKGYGKTHNCPTGEWFNEVSGPLAPPF